VTQGLSSADGHEGASAPADDFVTLDDVALQRVAVQFLPILGLAFAVLRRLAPRGTA
jgi:hypothetical protein